MNNTYSYWLSIKVYRDLIRSVLISLPEQFPLYPVLCFRALEYVGVWNWVIVNVVNFSSRLHSLGLGLNGTNTSFWEYFINFIEKKIPHIIVIDQLFYYWWWLGDWLRHWLNGNRLKISIDIEDRTIFQAVVFRPQLLSCLLVSVW